MFPDLSMHKLSGVLRFADAASPPSPENPALPVPAMVLTMSAAVNNCIRICSRHIEKIEVFNLILLLALRREAACIRKLRRHLFGEHDTCRS